MQKIASKLYASETPRAIRVEARARGKILFQMLLFLPINHNKERFPALSCTAINDGGRFS